MAAKAWRKRPCRRLAAHRCGRVPANSPFTMLRTVPLPRSAGEDPLYPHHGFSLAPPPPCGGGGELCEPEGAMPPSAGRRLLAALRQDSCVRARRVPALRSGRDHPLYRRRLPGLSLQPGDRPGRARMNQVLSESAGICNDGLHHRSAHPTRFFESGGATGSGAPLDRYTPAEIRTMPIQSDVVGHSPRSGIASIAESAGTNAPRAEAPEAPRMERRGHKEPAKLWLPQYLGKLPERPFRQPALVQSAIRGLQNKEGIDHQRAGRDKGCRVDRIEFRLPHDDGVAGGHR